MQTRPSQRKRRQERFGRLVSSTSQRSCENFVNSGNQRRLRPAAQGLIPTVEPVGKVKEAIPMSASAHPPFRSALSLTRPAGAGRPPAGAGDGNGDRRRILLPGDALPARRARCRLPVPQRTLSTLPGHLAARFPRTTEIMPEPTPVNIAVCAALTGRSRRNRICVETETE